ncbi:hypothetical protein J7L06_00900, partial [Candidatus Bathyarchaeota archaeon]|nr:hypothetical protein [Candidatus Bathyarchaeota archaeon]
DAEYYFREGKKEINIILKDKELLPIEVKETVNKEDITKFAKLIRHINAKKGIIISSNQRLKREEIEVIPAYMAESLIRDETIYRED